MKNIINTTVLLVPLIIGFSCTSSEWIDTKSFEMLGGTLLSEPDFVTLKRIHLDAPLLKDNDIIIQGKILSISPSLTHMVISDDAAKLLVVLTDVHYSKDFYKEGKTIKLLGRVSSERLGLPLFHVKSANISMDAIINKNEAKG